MDPPQQPAAQSSSKPRRNDEQFRQHALHGMPTCKHCLKSFHGLPEFSGHFRGSACPILHAAPDQAPHASHHDIPPPPAHGASAPGGTEGAVSDQQPLFHRPALQQLAERKQLKELASAIRASGKLVFCPECGQGCSKPSYLSRHANKIHPSMAVHHGAMCEWAQRKTRLSQPCEWCGAAYGTRPATHLQHCPVLWMCGHFFLRHASLADTGQRSLAASFQHGRSNDGGEGQGGAHPGPSGVRAVRAVHEGECPERQPHRDSDVDDSVPLDGSPGSGGYGRGQEQTPQLEPPTKWAKGDAKGDPKQDSGNLPQASGKGSSGELLSKAAVALGAQTGSGNARRQLPFRQPTSRADDDGPQSKPAQSAQPGQSCPPTSGQEQPGRMGRLARQWRPQLGLQPGPIARPKPPWTRRRPLEPESARQGQGARDGGLEGDDPPPGEAGIASRRRNVHMQLGQRVHPVLPDGIQSVVDHQAALRDSSGLESQEGVGPVELEPATPQCAVLLCLDKPPHTATQDGGGIREQLHQRGEGQGIDRGQFLAVLEVGQSSQETREGCTGAPRACHGGPAGAADHAAMRVPGHHRPLPRIAAVDVQLGVGCDPLYAHAAESDAGEPSALHLHPPIVPQQQHPPSGHDASAQPSWPLSPRTADRQAPQAYLRVQPAQACNLILLNRSAHCYANSIILSLLWTISQCPQGAQLDNLAWRRLLGWLVRRPQSVQLWQMPAWCDLMRLWSHPNRQHDVGEFLQHISPSMFSEEQRGFWEARTLQQPSGLVQAEDQGTMWPLLLPTGLSSLQTGTSVVSPQKLVIAWRGQAATHAAVALPELAVLQVCRFRPDGTKDFTPIKLSEAVYIPFYTGSGLNTSSARYTITAVVYHLGQSPLSGHYRSALIAQGRICYHTDDNVAAEVHTAELASRVEQNPYLYFLRKTI